MTWIERRSRSLPRSGEVWIHWKHTEDTPHIYNVLAITCNPNHMPFQYQSHAISVFGTDTETEDKLRLWTSPTLPGVVWLSDMQDNFAEEPFVVYRSAINTTSGILWVRHLQNFISADDRSPNGWRFIRRN